jgi:nicotinamide-nucleotide amidase
VVRLMTERGLTLSLAESCTGGGIAARVTDVPGSSEVLLGAAVTYSNAAKTDLVGVPAELIAKHGAVSAEVAEAMADGARARFGADIAVGVTGVAGPGGGTPDKPVGLVYLALSDARGTVVTRNEYLGGRADVRRRASQTALVMVRDRVLQDTTAREG